MNIWEINISISMMIFVILFFRKLGNKKVPKGAVMALWNLVLVRALIPYSIPIGNLPMFQERRQRSSDEILAVWEKVQSSQGVSKELIQQMQQENENLQLIDYIPWIWAVGAICLLLYFLVIHRKEHKILKNSIPVQNGAVERVIHQYTFRRKIRLYEGGSFETPVTYGILFPKILIPSDFSVASRLDIRNMIAHELEHIRKFDVGKRYLMALVLCIHWFNPLVWVMYRIYQVDQEMACDERVMRRMEEREAKNYVCTMIKMATEEKCLFTTATGFGGKNAAKKRILQALNGKKREVGGAVAAVLIWGCLLSAFVSFSQIGENHSSNRVSDNLANVEKEVKMMWEEPTPELVEPRFSGVSNFPSFDENFDYEGVMQDIIDNYNDQNQPLTEDQITALTIQNGIQMADIYKRQQKKGKKLEAEQIWMIDEYYGILND